MARARRTCSSFYDVVSTNTSGRTAARQGDPTGDTLTMDAAIERRLTVAVSWALARRATLDALEQFEESYALTEEFRDWLLCLEEHPDLLMESVLMVPRNLGDLLKQRMLEQGRGEGDRLGGH